MAKKKSKDKNLEIWTLDCETDPFKNGRIPKPFLWGLYTVGQYYQFATGDEVADFISDKEIIVYAHNGGKFDYHYLLHRMQPREPIIVISGRLAQWKIGKAEMRDSYNILPVPLAAYKKDVVDYAIFEASERDKPENRAQIETYLRNDCIYLHEFVMLFTERFGRHLTMAGASMATWETMRGIPAPKTDGSYYEYFSPYYYGGRVQCFKQGIINTPFKVADINSAYPFAMLCQHPIGSTFERYSNITSVRGAVGPCFIELDCASKGAFPWIDLSIPKHKRKLIFLNDSIIRTYRITGWEYLAAMEVGALSEVSIKCVYEFNELTDFKQYITHFYEARQVAKKQSQSLDTQEAALGRAMDTFTKLFMNSLYGKFGANPAEYDEFMPFEMGIDNDELCQCGDAKNCERGLYHFSGTLGPYTLGAKDLPEYRQRFFNVATAASITGYVRAMLFKAIARSTGLLYCDTDSIAAELVECEYGPLLGQWKDEGSFCEAAIAGKKMYAFKMDKKTARTAKEKDEDCSGYKQASKGVSLTAARIKKVAIGKMQIATREAPTYSLRKGPHFIARKVRMSATCDSPGTPDIPLA